MSNIFYIDGEFLPEENARIPVNDMAILRGYGIFDFFRTYGGKPFHLKDHLERLEHSAKSIALELPLSLEKIHDIVIETLKKNRHKDSNVRIVITGGQTEDFITPSGKPRLLVMVTEVSVYPEKWYRNGVKIITVPLERQIPAAKSLNYLSAILALKEAYQKNAVEAVYTDRKGNLREGTTSNFFVFIEGKMVTPGTEDILPGITRQVVLDLAKNEFEVQVRDIHMDELAKAQGAFLSSSNKQILPVVRVNDLGIGEEKTCKQTRLIMKCFEEYTKRYASGEFGF
ncbi:MAG: aminotransferase class IV [Desulfobacterales bacterium]